MSSNRSHHIPYLILENLSIARCVNVHISSYMLRIRENMTAVQVGWLCIQPYSSSFLLAKELSSRKCKIKVVTVHSVQDIIFFFISMYTTDRIFVFETYVWKDGKIHLQLPWFTCVYKIFHVQTREEVADHRVSA
jgi:hypothetical protein